MRHRKINEGILLTIKSGFEYQRFIIVKFINFSMVIIFGIKMTPAIVFNQCIAAKKGFHHENAKCNEKTNNPPVNLTA